MSLPSDMDKSWDHPWTTKEMRETRREWSLAGDVGLLNHLQQFSENLVSKMSNTQDSLNKLTTQLNETAILIDNVTNTSLALANTQFIESLVQEDTEVDDAEIHKKPEELHQEPKDQDSTANVIANVSESVKHGLRIMEEKYKRMEVIDSDSEDEGAAIVLSVILGPNNPYQDRPLPYVIGTEKWKTSDKIGLESSSSESEQIDDEGEESESDKNNQILHQSIGSNNGIKCGIDRLSSSLSSSEMENYNEPTNNVSYVNNEKLDNISQATINSESDSVTPVKILPKGVSDGTPNFAAELAKRLGSVRQVQNRLPADEATEPSINRFKDDLFKPEKEDETKISHNSERRLSENNNLFSDDVSTNFWKKQPQKSYTQNVIPPSLDVPPPIDITSTKPKSAIDDLFGDGDSDDSDDIFSSKSTMRKVIKENPSGDNSSNVFIGVQQSFLDIVTPGITSHIARSTPETNPDIVSLFGDKEENDTDLFGASKKPFENSLFDVSTSGVSDSGKRKLLGDDVNVSGDIPNSDITKKVTSETSQYKPSYLPTTDISGNHSNGNNRGANPDQDFGTDGNNQSSVIAEGRVSNIIASTTNSSRASTQQTDVGRNAASSAGVDFTSPQLTSTRLKSEEIYRERVTDSLFETRTPRNPWPESSGNGMSNSERDEGGEEALSSNKLDDVFENEDLFGPPPLPKADSKIGKAKVTSLFDESDSGDELFSTTSSGSRSQKSTDFFVTGPQNPEKSKFNASRKVFIDNDIDIFDSKSSPDVDIFGLPKQRCAVKTSAQEEDTLPNILEEKLREQVLSKSSSSDKTHNTGTTLLKSSFFEEDDNIDDDDLFGISSLKTEKIVQGPMWKDSDDEDLFLTKKQVKGSQSTASSEKPVSKNEKLNFIAKDGEAITSVTSNTDNEANVKARLLSSSRDGHGFSLKDDNSDDLFGDKKLSSAGPTTTTQKKSAPVEEVEPEKKSSQVKSDAKKEMKLPEPKHLAMSSSDNITPILPSLKTEEENKNDLFESQGGNRRANKRHPPNTLSIKTTPSMVEESLQTSRRALGGKIKDLMGKMGDLKILSPTDTPPLLKKVEEKMDDEFDSTDKDSDDGRRANISQIDTGPLFVDKRPICASSPPSSHDGNVEVAISFDEPAQVETLSISASKSRAKIRAKRRPQSRHARKSALQQSGISFDTVDNAEELQSNREEEPNNCAKDLTSNSLSTSSTTLNSAMPSSDRLSTPFLSVIENERVGDASLLTTEDKSEVCSLSKECLMSTNKNTLLSPSTDEEDLFDVPPDLPEDPQKEDTLFGHNVDSEHSTKPQLDLFTDDANGDLFSSTLVKPVKKSSRDSSLGLFDNDIQHDEDDGLFGSVANINTFKQDTQKVSHVQEPQKKINIFEDDEDDFNLFVAMEKPQSARNIHSKIIPEEKISTSVKPTLTSKSVEHFDEKDIFVTKRMDSKQTAAGTSLFSLDDEVEDDQIFTKLPLSSSSSVTENEQKTVKDKPVTVKKIVTRDLKKTAEKIMEDPLSLLQDD